jgi:hypothetical protein
MNTMLGKSHRSSKEIYRWRNDSRTSSSSSQSEVKEEEENKKKREQSESIHVRGSILYSNQNMKWQLQSHSNRSTSRCTFRNSRKFIKWIELIKSSSCSRESFST